jgi:hypothetical protein
VAVRSERQLYLVREQKYVPEDDVHGAFGFKLERKFFVLPDGKDLEARVSRTITLLLEQWRAVSNMKVINDRLIPQGQIEMRFRGKVSSPLSSGSEADITNVLTYWAADSEFVTIGTYLCSMGQKGCSGHMIFVDVSSSLLIRRSADKSYRQPNAREVLQSREHSEQTLQTALRRSCSMLHGDLSDGVCIVK